MYECSFPEWIIIVITIYSDCSCLVKPCFIVIFIVAWSNCACFICISRLLLTMILFCYCFQENLSVWFKSFIESRVRCEWVLATVPDSYFKSRVCFSVFLLIEYRTCKRYFALSLLACMFRCSFIVWMIIVVTIYCDCSFFVKPCFIASFVFVWSHYACSICISRFLLTMIILCCYFQEILVRMVQEFHRF